MRRLLGLACALVVASCGESDTAPPPPLIVSTESSASTPPTACTTPATVTGHATWYGASSASGACGYAYAAHPYFGAMNEEDYRSAAACGTCVRVTFKGQTLDVTIVDLCPYQGNEQWCGPGGHHIDLGQGAFAVFADPNQGVLDTITWSYVACHVQGGITYTFKNESTEWWAEILVGNFPYEITKLEYGGTSGFVPLTRQSYNYFSTSSGMGPGPYTFRVTDINGSTVTDTGVPLVPGGTAQGAANFGACP